MSFPSLVTLDQLNTNKEKKKTMKFLAHLALFLGVATANPLVAIAPRAQDVKIRSVSAVGSGCPLGHAYATIDASGTIFDVAFDDYIVQVGPGTSSSDARKNCRVTLNIEFPKGMSYVTSSL